MGMKTRGKSEFTEWAIEQFEQWIGDFYDEPNYIADKIDEGPAAVYAFETKARRIAKALGVKYDDVVEKYATEFEIQRVNNELFIALQNQRGCTHERLFTHITPHVCKHCGVEV